MGQAKYDAELEEMKDKVVSAYEGKKKSSRFRAWQTGGAARHSLLYHMMSKPFTDEQLNLALKTIQDYFTPTEELKRFHDDFLWKVILPECLIKIYQKFFDIPTMKEAERKMRDTPMPDEEEDTFGLAGPSPM